MDIERNRAWRRRKARAFFAKLKKSRQIFGDQFNEESMRKPSPATKQHRHGALTHAQHLRVVWATEGELHDQLWISEAA